MIKALITGSIIFWTVAILAGVAFVLIAQSSPPSAESECESSANSFGSYRLCLAWYECDRWENEQLRSECYADVINEAIE